MGTFLNAVKNLINSLTAKTSSTASTADMVQLHDANGNPNGKISLADLASVLGVRRFYQANAVEGYTIDVDNARLGLLYVAEGSSGRCGLYLVTYTMVGLVFATAEDTLPWTVTKDRTANMVSVTKNKSGLGNLDVLYISCRK